MKTNSITIKRVTEAVFEATSNFTYWSDGSCINARVAFDGNGALSNYRAQTIDAANGLRYVLVGPLLIKKPSVIDAACGLAVGESAVVVIG